MADHLEDRTILTAPQQPSLEEQVRVEPSPRWVRVRFGGQEIANSKRVRLVWEPRRLPVYYFPATDVRMDLLTPTDHTRAEGEGARTRRYDVVVGEAVAPNAAWSRVGEEAERAGLENHVAFYWAKMDAWYEEDDEVFVHPRDPHHRVDVLHSSRHVKVVVDGEVVAETRRPSLLFETGLPTRYYIPKLDVRLNLLEPSDTTTACPYKGRASYSSVRVGDQLLKDLVWGYPAPIPECPKIENLLCFFNEKVDLYVDGELQPRPKTPWS